MKKTSLYHRHIELGAKMVPFGGYEMPVSYSSIKDEHHCVRNHAGVFDVSHMGEFWVEGPKAFSLLQEACSNDIAKLYPGKAQYNYFPNQKGGVVDDLIIYQIEEEKYLLVVNASNIEKDWQWLKKLNETHKARLTNASSEISLLAVQGPQAIAMVQRLSEQDLTSLPFYAHCTTTIANLPNVLVATTGYTGAGGVELYCPNLQVEALWDALFDEGKEFGLQPIGLAARDTLRLEMGYCLYGHEIDDTTSPIAAGLGWVSQPETGCINANQIAAEKKNGTPHHLVGFVMQERGIPRQGHAIVDNQGKTIGNVTSGTQSPSLNQAIGMGYVPTQFAKPGSQIRIEIRGKYIAASVVKMPFYKT